MKLISILGLLVMAAALVGLFAIDSIFSRSPIAIGLQVIAIALLVWARLTNKADASLCVLIPEGHHP